MTTIAGAGGSESATAGSASISPKPGGHAIDPNAFLKLLVAELQYQDPTKPMDTTQLVQQLSSMSQIEQAAQMNARLALILDQVALGNAASLIGLTATSADGERSGAITSIRLAGEGAIATLSNGNELLLSKGVMVGA